MRMLWFFTLKPRVQQWVCPGCGTQSPSLGSSTKCFRIVTLQSSCKRRWLHTCCNLTQTQSQVEGMCLCVTRGMDTLACLFLYWRDLPQLTALLLCPWIGRISKGTSQCQCDNVNTLAEEQILLMWKEIHSVSILVRGNSLCYLG